MKIHNYMFVTLLSVVGCVHSQSADLSVTQSTNLTRATVGQSLIYTLTANNDGPDNNTQILLDDYLPPEVSVLNIDPACAVDMGNPQLINCNISLPANTSQNFDIEVMVDTLPDIGPRLYLSGTMFDAVSRGFFRFWLDTGMFDVLSASSFDPDNPRGIFLQDDGGILIAYSGDLNTALADGEISYSHPLELFTYAVASGDLLINPHDVIKAPNGLIYVADSNGLRLDGMGNPLPDTTGRIIAIDPNTNIQSLVSEGGFLDTPNGLIWDNGLLIVTDLSGKITSIDPSTGQQQLISQAGLLQSPTALTMVNGIYYVTDSIAGVIAIDSVS